MSNYYAAVSSSKKQNASSMKMENNMKNKIRIIVQKLVLDEWKNLNRKSRF